MKFVETGNITPSPPRQVRLRRGRGRTALLGSAPFVFLICVFLSDCRCRCVALWRATLARGYSGYPRLPPRCSRGVEARCDALTQSVSTTISVWLIRSVVIKSGQQVQARGAARTRVAQQKSEHFAAAQGMAPRAQHSGELPASIATHGACGSWSRREETLTHPRPWPALHSVDERMFDDPDVMVALGNILKRYQSAGHRNS
jgi:hypothetical protein